LKVKFADFQQITRSKSVGEAIDSLADLERLSVGLLERRTAAVRRDEHTSIAWAIFSAIRVSGL
jgi:hypothetical protein